MDNVLVEMPKTLKEFLVCLAVYQEFVMQLVIGVQKKTRDEYNVTVRLDEKFRYMEPCLEVVKDSHIQFDYSGWSEKVRGEYDCFVDFDFERASKVALVTKRHITQGFGILTGTFLGALSYGVVPQKYPILKPLMPESPQAVKIGVFGWDRPHVMDTFLTYMESNYPELVIETTPCSSSDVEDIVKYIRSFSIVIGGHGLYTYLARSLEIQVIEIFSTPEELTLYADHVTYPLLKDATAELVWAVWETTWQSNLEATYITSNQDLRIRTDHEVSTVVSAEEK